MDPSDKRAWQAKLASGNYDYATFSVTVNVITLVFDPVRRVSLPRWIGGTGYGDRPWNGPYHVNGIQMNAGVSTVTLNGAQLASVLSEDLQGLGIDVQDITEITGPLGS